MASVQEPEIQLAQKLASNEKAIRTKAMKKLRKYISARSQRAAGGFNGDELLKLWKGLFYCLWMQDKPLLQEELSNQISALIHSFHDIDKQLMYLESFLQTFKREWTGIDRLRMDKFYQLVRFIFRQTFDVLRRRRWESSAVGKFLMLLKSHLLQNDSEVPSGLLLHILDLYMTELAAVGAAELTADQNLTFVEPFCRKAAKTKNQTVFSAICKSFFSTIIDQAPFAVEDLMREVKTAEVSGSDSGQESEEGDDKQEEDKKAASKDRAGSNLKKEESEDELLHFEVSDTELPDEDIGPVLQFDYAALADKLFEAASRSSTPGHNRQKLYKIIKVLRNLSEGIFPQDEYPEEVSTDEDDDMFGSRKRMKRPAHKDKEEEGKPAGKKSKAGIGEKIKAVNGQSSNTEPLDIPVNKEKNKKKKKAAIHEGATEPKSLECSEEQKQRQFSTSELPAGAQLQPLVGRRLQAESCTTGEKNQSKGERVSGPLATEREEQQLTSATSETSFEVPAPDPRKNKSKKGLKAETGILALCSEASGEECCVALAEPTAATPAKNKQQHQKAEAKLGCDLLVNDVGITGISPAGSGDALDDDLTPNTKKIPDITGLVKKTHKKKIQKIKEQKVVADTGRAGPRYTNGKIISGVQHKNIRKKRDKRELTTDQNKINETIAESVAAGVCTQTPVKRKTNQKGEKQTNVSESPQLNAGKMQQNRKTPNLADDQLNELGVSCADSEQPLVEAEMIGSNGKAAKKKRKIPVEFEFEADELEGKKTISSTTEAKSMTKKTTLNNDAYEPCTPQSLKKSNKKGVSRLLGSGFITFQRKAAVPTPLYCKTKGSPNTPASSKMKQQLPKSESKKVTFGLKNNKTAEFKKTDRSLVLSPDGLSRVPFDPQQKPKFGVLKSPPTSGTAASKKPAKTKKIPTCSKKTGATSLPNTPKRRPLAADFF
ncbi:ribosomal RNA processing protein 1 homolog B [Fundulus diaphanus]